MHDHRGQVEDENSRDDAHDNAHHDNEYSTKPHQRNPGREGGSAARVAIVSRCTQP